MEPAALRRLFRLVDSDHNQRLSHAEFRRALVELGFESALDSTTFSRLLQEIDLDRSGQVTEAEFISYFQLKRRIDLERMLAASSSKDGASAVEITIVQYQPPRRNEHEGHVPAHKETRLRAAELASWLRDHLEASLALPGAKLWIDVRGDDSNVLELLASTLQLPANLLSDANIYQKQRVELVGSAAEPVPATAPGATVMAGKSFFIPTGRGSIMHVGSSATRLVESKKRAVDATPSDSETAGVGAAAASAAVLPPAPHPTARTRTHSTIASLVQQPSPPPPKQPAVHLLFHAMSLHNVPIRRKCYYSRLARLLERVRLGSIARFLGILTVEDATYGDASGATPQNPHSSSATYAARELAAQLAAAPHSSLTVAAASADERPSLSIDVDDGSGSSVGTTANPLSASSSFSAIATSQSQRKQRKPLTSRIVLASPAHLQRHPPEVNAEQVCIIMPSEHVLLTLHSGTSSQLSSGTGRPGATRGASAGGLNVFSDATAAIKKLGARSISRRNIGIGSSTSGSGSSSASPASPPSLPEAEESVLGILFEAIRSNLRVSRPDSGLHAGTVRSLAVEIVQAVHQYNFNLRDILADWHLMLERSVNSGDPSNQSTMPHIYALEKTAESYAKVLEPLKDVLNPRKWDEADSSVAAVVAAAAARRAFYLGGEADDEAAAESLAGDTFAGASAVGGPLAAGASSSLAAIFAEERHAFQQMAHDVSGSYDDVRGIRDACKALRDVHRAHQDDKRNQVLYVLTVVSGLALPINFLTGYFGMNFTGKFQIPCTYPDHVHVPLSTYHDDHNQLNVLYPLLQT